MNYICVRNLIRFSYNYLLLELLIGEVSGLVLYFTIPTDIVSVTVFFFFFFFFLAHIFLNVELEIKLLCPKLVGICLL